MELKNVIRQIVITLEQTKETKNMMRYDAPGADEDARRQGNVPNLYVRKTALAAAFGGFPLKLKITLENGEA